MSSFISPRRATREMRERLQERQDSFERNKVRCASPGCANRAVYTTRVSLFCSQHKHRELQFDSRDLRITTGTARFEVHELETRVELRDEAIEVVVPARERTRRLREYEADQELLLYGPPTQRRRFEYESPAAIFEQVSASSVPSVPIFEASVESPASVVESPASPASVVESPPGSPAPVVKSVEESTSAYSTFTAVVPIAIAAAQLASSFVFPRPAHHVPGLLALPGSSPVRLAPYIGPALAALGSFLA